MPPAMRAKRVYKRKAVARVPRAIATFHGAKHTNTAPNNQFARVVETTLDFASLDLNTPYNLTTSLRFFPRALAVAANFRFYRIVEVQHEWRPAYNVAQAGITATATLPLLYSIVNTAGLEPAYFNPTWLLEQGAKPILFDKSVNIKYAPKTVIFNGPQNGVGTQMRSSKAWLPCFTQSSTSGAPDVVNSQPEYYGSLFELATPGTVAITPLGEVWTTIVVEFKEPMVAEPATPGEGAIGVQKRSA